MSYLFPTLLTLGLPLALLPLAIHLINLRRRQKIAWAAMDFLLESQKRNKKWIVLRQILLLLIRTLAVAVVAFMLAGPVIQSSWAALFGRGVTHHLLLIDDSYSMGDRHAAGSVQKEASRVALQIVGAARNRGGRQLVTLLPFSAAQGLAAGGGPPIDRTPLDSASMSRLELLLEELRTSETSAGPADAFQAVQKLPLPQKDETRIVYLLSDFRKVQWDEASRLRELASNVRAQSSQLHLIQCAESTHPNLGVVELRPEAGVRGAGVETWMEATIANFGEDEVAAATLEVRHNDTRLPALQFGELGPGQQETRRFRVALAPEGSQIVAQLPDDDLLLDNQRYFAVQAPPAYPVLVIDESERGDDGRYLVTALSPGGRNLAGWAPQIERRTFLRNREALARFSAIVLLDASRLDESEITNLEAYAAAGGGVALFVGPQVDPDFYNERLYRGGEGILAAPLNHPAQLLRDVDGSEPDLKIDDAPLFRIFQGRRNSFVDLTKFDYYYSLDPEWIPNKSPGVSVLARLRNRSPLVVEKSYGKGVAVLHLFKLSPMETDLGSWSNFAATPAFPVYVNELVGKLSAKQRAYDQRLVDDTLEIAVPAADYLPEVGIRPPITSGLLDYQTKLEPIDDQLRLLVPGPLASGIWQLTWTRREGPTANSGSPVAPTETGLIAVNVAPSEGDLHVADEAHLSTSLEGVDVELSRSSQFTQSSDQLAGYGLSALSAALFAALLIADQLLAFSASYHARPPRRNE